MGEHKDTWWPFLLAWQCCSYHRRRIQSLLTYSQFISPLCNAYHLCMHELLQAFGLTWALWGGILFQKDKQESSGSLEALSDAIPQPMPFPPTAVRSGSPKLDPSEVYLKSKTMYEDKREYINPSWEMLSITEPFLWHACGKSSVTSPTEFVNPVWIQTFPKCIIHTNQKTVEPVQGRYVHMLCVSTVMSIM